MISLKNYGLMGLILPLLFAGSRTAGAFTAADANTIFAAYNTAFYVANSGNAYYKTDNGAGTGPGWWTFAEEIEMAEDCYARSGSASFSNTVSTLCNGFLAANGSSWTYDNYNDDMTWGVIAFSRAYLITGNTTFLNTAKSNFDAMYARGWDTNFTGGGLWWSTAKGSKNACINGPAAVAACYLYGLTGDASYLAKAQACYAWERRVLFSTNTGAIDDNIATGTNGISTWASTYNQGTFIGAANFLYRLTRLPFYYQDAILAAKYTANSIASAGILPVYSSGDLAGFNGIFARWAAQFARDQNLWPAYGPWLNTNANAAWRVRNTNNLSWYNWSTGTPAGTNVLASWDCSDSVVIMQVGLTNPPDSLGIAPGTGFTAVAQYSVPPDPASLTLVLTNLGATALNWSLANTSAWLNVSATAGTLAAGGPAASVPVSLQPAVVTNLAPGNYYTSIWLTNLASGVVQSRSFALAVSAGPAPITLTGYNADVLAPNSATAAAPVATAFDLPNNLCFYQAGLNASTRGLPPDGVFLSQADYSTVFRLLPYGLTNALVLGDTYPGSATLTLANPQTYTSLAILACSANASGATGTLVLNFTNGTHSPPLNFNVPDWYGTFTNTAIRGFDRLRLGSSFGPDNDGAANPNLYQTTLNLAALGLDQPIASITFTKPANSGSQQTVGIFAVSGMVMPPQAAIVQAPQSVTNNQPAQAATLSVVASGVAPLSYQWFYSASGAAGSFAPLAGQTNSSVTLGPVLQTANAGSFFVVVSNNFGSVTSTVAALTVFRAPVITQQPAPAIVWKFTGATNAWSVSVNAAQPVSYQWICNGTNLPAATGATNRMINLQVANSGVYSAVVSNAFGAVTSSVASLTVVPAPTYPFGQQVLAARPLGYWRLDETSGTVAHDYVAGNNGSYTPRVLLGQPGDHLVDTHTAATFGTLLSSNSCATNIAVDFSTTGNAAFSVEAWVYGGSQTTDAGIVTKGYGGGGEQFNLDCGAGSHAFRFFVRDAGGTAYLANSSVTPGGHWHHLVGVCDENNGYVYLYVDGTNAAQATVPPYVGILSSPLAMSIGSRQAGLAPVNTNQFVGSVEEVALYGYALTASQVKSHYQAATNRPPVFLGNPIAAASAQAGQLYASSLATNASDPNGNPVSFAKISGPSWLSVAAGGSLAGTPYSLNVGTNVFVVSVADAFGLSNTATLNLPVIAAPPIVMNALVQGGQMTLNWSGGIGPFQLQMTTNLAAPNWESLGAALSTNRLLIPLSNSPAFYRLYGQ